MTAAVNASRYNADIFDTASIRSAAPSYVSEVPSYHSTAQQPEAAPAYAPRAGFPATPTQGPAQAQAQQARRTTGLPPVPPMPASSVMTIHNYRLASWSANNAPAARHYRNVAERRITDGRYPVDSDMAAAPVPARRHYQPLEAGQELRPLEDPSLVGEVAAAQARRQRLAREAGDDILIREDRQWDWMLAHMNNRDERERSWTRLRRDAEPGHRKKLLQRISSLMGS
ncbi:hypothetical protein CDD82_4975 [Ophiocordyceps australis]|uniref:Uncharacterized protein n=1 Tax=Ophiocordyceps australis TaxID=1399860 RepID=A0A2C5Z2W4_9HYPO|nr:hypothetical protein CDD82_4975 [Ophiocordyceps australis]